MGSPRIKDSLVKHADDQDNKDSISKNHHTDAEDLNPEWEVQSPATMENKVREGTTSSSAMWQSVKGEKASAVQGSISNAQVETQRRLR